MCIFSSCSSLRFFFTSCLQCQGCGGAAVRLNDHQGQQRLQSVFIITPFYFYFCTKREAVQTDRRPPQEHASIYSQPSLPLAPCALIGFQRLQPLPLSPPPLLTLTTPTSLKLSNPAAHADVAPPTLHQSCFSFVVFFKNTCAGVWNTLATLALLALWWGMGGNIVFFSSL